MQVYTHSPYTLDGPGYSLGPVSNSFERSNKHRAQPLELDNGCSDDSDHISVEEFTSNGSISSVASTPRNRNAAIAADGGVISGFNDERVLYTREAEMYLDFTNKSKPLGQEACKGNFCEWNNKLGYSDGYELDSFYINPRLNKKNVLQSPVPALFPESKRRGTETHTPTANQTAPTIVHSLSNLLGAVDIREYEYHRRGCEMGKRKSKFCRFWLAGEECPFENRCLFAHGCHDLHRKMDFFSVNCLVQRTKRPFKMA